VDKLAHARIDALQVVLAAMLTDLACDNQEARTLDSSRALRNIRAADDRVRAEFEAAK
jgi:hypothetical protein